MEPLTVRHASTSDAEALTRVHVASWRAAYRREISAAFLGALDLRERTAITEKRLARPGSLALLAESADRTLGFCHLGPTRDRDDDAARVCEIYALHVHPDHWRQGIGAHLFGAARREAEARGFENLSLWVLDTNARARSFYAALGLDADGASKIEEIGPGVRLHELRYRGPVAPG